MQETVGSIPGWERAPGEGNGNPHQYSGLENPMDRGVWWATVHGVTKCRTCLVTKQQQLDVKLHVSGEQNLLVFTLTLLAFSRGTGP